MLVSLVVAAFALCSRTGVTGVARRLAGAIVDAHSPRSMKTCETPEPVLRNGQQLGDCIIHGRMEATYRHSSDGVNHPRW